MFSKRIVIVDADSALPGRDQPIEVSPIHEVLGTRRVPPFPDDTSVLYVAMGCFWGAERLFWQTPGVFTTAVGYMGGYTPNPTYAETCTGMTGHTETALVVYHPAEVSLEVLMKVFWENHDPTTPNRQGNDVGTQYRSAVFATSPEQLAGVEESRDRYQTDLRSGGYGDITTQIGLATSAGDGVFYYAEEEHQAYLHKHPGGYCNHGFCQVGYASSGT